MMLIWLIFSVLFALWFYRMAKMEFKNQFRIRNDGSSYGRYHAQVRFWKWPWQWFDYGGINSHRTPDEAEEYIKNRQQIIKVDL